MHPFLLRLHLVLAIRYDDAFMGVRIQEAFTLQMKELLTILLPYNVSIQFGIYSLLGLPRLAMAGIHLAKARKDSRLRMSRITSPFCHPRWLLRLPLQVVGRGGDPSGEDQDGCPITNVGHDGDGGGLRTRSTKSIALNDAVLPGHRSFAAACPEPIGLAQHKLRRRGSR